MIGESKYHNKAVVTADGQRFASGREYRRWCELKLMEQAGVISGLVRQVPYWLHVAPLHADGRHLSTWVPIGFYMADFDYVRDGELVTEDAKGVRTPLFRWKAKHFKIQYGREIVEV